MAKKKPDFHALEQQQSATETKPPKPDFHAIAQQQPAQDGMQPPQQPFIGATAYSTMANQQPATSALNTFGEMVGDAAGQFGRSLAELPEDPTRPLRAGLKGAARGSARIAFTEPKTVSDIAIREMGGSAFKPKQLPTQSDSMASLPTGVMLDVALRAWDAVSRTGEQVVTGMFPPEDVEPFSVTGLAQGVGETTPQLARDIGVSIPMGMAGGPSASLATFAASAAVSEGTRRYNEAFERYQAAGFDEQNAHEAALAEAKVAGTAAGATNVLPGMVYFSSTPVGRELSGAMTSRLVQAAAKGAGAESLQEGMEQFIPDLLIGTAQREDMDALQWVYDQDREYWELLLHESTIGAIVGGSANTVIQSVQEHGVGTHNAPPELTPYQQQLLEQFGDRYGTDAMEGAERLSTDPLATGDTQPRTDDGSRIEGLPPPETIAPGQPQSATESGPAVPAPPSEAGPDATGQAEPDTGRRAVSGEDVQARRPLDDTTQQLQQRQAENEGIVEGAPRVESQPMDEDAPATQPPADKAGAPLEDLTGQPVPRNPDGTLTLYHRTTPEAAAEINETGQFMSAENTDEVFFSTSPEGNASGYGDAVVEVRVDPATVRLDDAFRNGEVHVAVAAADLNQIQTTPAQEPPDGIRQTTQEQATQQATQEQAEETQPEAAEVEEQQPSKPSSLQEFLNPGEDFGAMGAAEDPNMERGPDGQLRPRLRSAKDLVASRKPDEDGTEFQFQDAETEQRYQEARKGIRRLPLATRLRGFWNKLVKNTRHGSLPELPRTQQFGEARAAVEQYRNGGHIAIVRTQQLLSRTLDGMNSSDYDIFTRMVILRDLVQTEGALPFGLNEDTAQQELARLEEVASDEVQAALEFREQWMTRMREDYVEAHKQLGVDMSERLSRQDYFRHQVLYWMRVRQEERAGISARPSGTPQARLQTQRGFLKQREGSELDINANYLQAEFEVATQMIADTERAIALARLQRAYDIRPQLLEEHGQDGWRDAIPDTHAEYQFRPGRAMFLAHSLPESVAQRLLEGAGETLGLTADDISTVMALGQQYRPVVVEQQIVRQLEQVENLPEIEALDRVVRTAVRWWKVWQLQSPLRVVRYNLRNMSEVDKAVALNPSTLKKVPQAIIDLAHLYRGDFEASGSAWEWVQRGGARTLVRINELEEVNELRRFARLLDKAQKKSKLRQASEVPQKTWTAYWQSVGLATDFRESILRYAAYLDFLEQIQKQGEPRNYAGSNPEQVKGIQSDEDKAFRLSADLLGDYSDVSVVGQWLRTHAFPFWSFQELNARTYLRGMANLASNEQTAVKAGLAVGRALGIGALIRTPLVAYKIGRIAILYYGFQALLTAVNRFVFPDEDDDLPPDIKRQPHITLGRNKDGDVMFFNRLGTAGDFLEWFGADQLYYDVKDLLDGRRTLKDIATDWAKSPANKVIGGVTPMLKGTGEALAKRQLYPDAFEPRLVRDQMGHIARALGMSEIYAELTDQPRRQTLTQRLITSPYYSTDPDAAAYYEILSRKWEFLRKEYGQGAGFSESERGYALWQFKRALRFKDEKAANRFLQQYFALGGTSRGLQQSLRAMHPLSGMNESRRRHFLSTLREEDRERLGRAINYYREVVSAGGD